MRIQYLKPQSIFKIINNEIENKQTEADRGQGLGGASGVARSMQFSFDRYNRLAKKPIKDGSQTAQKSKSSHISHPLNPL